MKQIILLIFVLYSMSAQAQFFFDFPRQQTEQRREKVVLPEYKKGKEGIQSFILKNFKQPKIRERVDGKIVVAVIVNTKGNVDEAQVVRSVSSALDAEAVRVCKRMTFKPAKRGKEKVKGRIDITFPIRNGRVSFIDLPTTEV